jgi:lipopolysaccharide/colanic/teichoic acid biosynthesis glycosyltransferase
VNLETPPNDLVHLPPPTIARRGDAAPAGAPVVRDRGAAVGVAPGRADRRADPRWIAIAWRAVEIAIALGALALTWPIMLLVALVIRLDSRGPALFGQRRVGLHGRHFTFYKFRTLYVDARERFPELYAYAYTAEEVRTLKFKREADPRVTRMGRWLRKSTLDELPNFWNLLKGDIALVGPRPEIPEMVPHYQPQQLAKFSVKPGITGLAQINGRGNLAFQQTIAYDLEYVRQKSAALDLRIIARTIRLLATFDGAF